MSISTNERGGKGSTMSERYDLIPAYALKQVALAFGEGARKYGDHNWRLVRWQDHLNHAVAHIQSARLVDSNDGYVTDHYQKQEVIRRELGHAAARVLMALTVALCGRWASNHPKLGKPNPSSLFTANVAAYYDRVMMRSLKEEESLFERFGPKKTPPAPAPKPPEPKWDVERYAGKEDTVTFSALGHDIQVKRDGEGFSVKMRANDDITEYMLKRAFERGEIKY